MKTADLLLDAFDRVNQTVHRAIDGLDVDTLTFRADPEANTIAWLAWHIGRVQDDHLSDAFGTPQVWVQQGWAEHFGLPFDQDATGYGQDPDEVGRIGASADLLTGYLDAVHQAARAHLSGIADADLDRVVDPSWDPPVTLGVRLISVIADGLQHAGQASFVKGIAQRR